MCDVRFIEEEQRCEKTDESSRKAFGNTLFGNAHPAESVTPGEFSNAVFAPVFLSLFFCFPFSLSLSLSLSLSYIDSSISFAILFHSLEVLIENVFSLIRGIIDISRERIDTSGEFCAAHHHYITRAYEQNLRTDSPSPAVTVEDARFWK